MARFIVVEGTSTPCAGFLRRGERRKFAVDDRLRKMVKIGCVKVVEGSLDGRDDDRDDEQLDGPVGERTDEEGGQDERDDDPPTVDLLKPPRNNASREKWAVFLRAKGIQFPDGDESKGELWAGRDDLVMIWQQASGGS